MIDKINSYSKYLNEINTEAYKNVYMLSNPTLSKNPYSKTKFLHNIINNEIPRNSYMKNILLFYIKNILLFISFFIVYLYSKLNKDKREIDNKNNIILVDSFYGINELDNNVIKKDNYFKLLYEYMDDRNISYYITPKFYGFKNPLKYIKFYKIMKEDNSKSFIDISYIGSKEIVQIIYFIFWYPLEVYKLKKSIKENTLISDIFREDLIYSLSGTDFYPYIRYLFGKNLSNKLKEKEIKVISWCEYQVIDKNFYKGLRENTKKIKIYGTQFLFKFPSYSCLYIPEVDQKLGISPDVILVTGKIYIPKTSVYDYRIGPAFRYAKLYNTKYNISNMNRIIVMLPYVQEDAFNVINIMKQSEFFVNTNIDFKIHPDFICEKDKYLKVMGQKWKIIDTYPKFNYYSFVISSGSGSMMELVCNGLSAIIIASKNSFTTNPMPEFGQYENWDIVNKVSELYIVYKHLLDFRISNQDRLEKNIIYYRENFLSTVNDKIIMKNFDFDK